MGSFRSGEREPITAMLRGDVYLAALTPTEGSEQSGTRPVIVVSRNAINANSPVVIVVPVTGLEHKGRIYPSQVVLKADEGVSPKTPSLWVNKCGRLPKRGSPSSSVVCPLKDWLLLGTR